MDRAASIRKARIKFAVVTTLLLGLLVWAMVMSALNPAPATADTPSTTTTTVHHSMCNRYTGECYDPGADYTPSENDPQYYGH